MKLPFGKFKGQALVEVPDWYLEWLQQQAWITEPLASSVKGEADYRRRLAVSGAPPLTTGRWITLDDLRGPGKVLPFQRNKDVIEEVEEAVC